MGSGTPVRRPAIYELHQSPFQRRVLAAVEQARAAGDLLDARILMRLVRAVDEADYVVIEPLARVLRPGYRDSIGAIPASRAADCCDGGRDDPRDVPNT